jgi:stearoyl-CoA desaturase (delta-9 desaturase)
MMLSFNITPARQFTALMLCHLAFIYWCLTYASWANFSLIFLVYFFTGCFGMTMTFHRLLTHRSWNAPKWFEYFGTFCGTIGLQGSSLAWTCAHRLHHAKADRQGDPHSPAVLGFVNAHFLSMFSPINIKQSPVIRDKFHIFMHRYYFHVNVLYGLILFMLGGVFAVLHFWMVPAFVLWHAGNVINTFCHTRWFGYRKYNVPDNSVNNPIMGILMWGEGWHNNHHRYQARPNIGEKWYEIDIGYMCIKLINKLKGV